jgi:hypothetical protein
MRQVNASPHGVGFKLMPGAIYSHFSHFIMSIQADSAVTQIFMFGEKVNPGGNLLFRFLSQAAKVVPALADTESGICLLPYRFIKGIIILIEGKDNGKIGVIFTAPSTSLL